MGRGRDEQAVEVVHKVASYNGKTSNLTIEDLRGAGKLADTAVDDVTMDTSVLAAVRRNVRMFSSSHVRSLFATRKMAWSTTILIILWGKSMLRDHCAKYQLICCVLQPSLASRFRCRSLHRSKYPYSGFATQVQRFRDILVSSFSRRVVSCQLLASLATREADFGDNSTYITYRNVCTFTFPSSIDSRPT